MQKIIINSIMITIAIIVDVLSSDLLPFLHLPFIGKTFKISFLVLFLASFCLGFRNGFVVCIGYAIYHLCKAIIIIYIVKKDVFNFSMTLFFYSCFLDYLIPDLTLVLASLLRPRTLNQYIVKKRSLFLILLIIIGVKFFCLVCSGYYIYGDFYRQQSSAFIPLFPKFETRTDKGLFLFCNAYASITCLITLGVSFLFLLAVFSGKQKFFLRYFLFEN